MMRYAKGWNRSVRPAKYHLAPRTAPADTVDMTDCAPPIFDQWQWGSCFGHGSAGAGTAAFAAAGIPLDWVMSPAGIYRITRCVTRSRMGQDPSTHPLSDTGSYPVDGFEAMEQWGIHPLGQVDAAHNTDCFGGAVNAEPVQAELESDGEHLLTGHQVSGSSGVASALSERYPVGFGIFVDTAFEEWNPAKGFLGAPVNPYDPNGGGHFIYTVGYTRAGLLAQDINALPERLRPTDSSIAAAICQNAAKLASGARIGFGVNSWSSRWGLHGFFLYLDALLDDPQSGDTFAFEAKMRSV